MQIGPFPQRDVDEISKVLQGAGVPFEVQVDQEAVEKALAEAQQRRSTTMSNEFMDPATHYFEIPDDRISELGNLLAPFGISLESDPNEPDFSEEDYYCPECHHHSTSPGACPKHHVPLLTYEARKKHELENERGLVQKRGFWLVLAALAVAVFMILRR